MAHRDVSLLVPSETAPQEPSIDPNQDNQDDGILGDPPMVPPPSKHTAVEWLPSCFMGTNIMDDIPPYKNDFVTELIVLFTATYACNKLPAFQFDDYTLRLRDLLRRAGVDRWNHIYKLRGAPSEGLLSRETIVNLAYKLNNLFTKDQANPFDRVSCNLLAITAAVITIIHKLGEAYAKYLWGHGKDVNQFLLEVNSYNPLHDRSIYRPLAQNAGLSHYNRPLLSFPPQGTRRHASIQGTGASSSQGFGRSSQEG